MTSRLPRSGPLFLVIASLVASLALAPSPVLAQDPPDFWLPLECGQTYYGYTYAPSHGPSGINAIDFHQDRPRPGANQDKGDEVLASAAGWVMPDTQGLIAKNGELTIDHGGGWQTQYAHMTQVAVYPGGEWVELGELLGFISDVGVPTGQGEAHHLHYQQNQGTSQAQVANFAEYGSYQYNPTTYEYPAITSGLCRPDGPFTDHFDSPFRAEINWLFQDQKQALGELPSNHPVFSCDTIRYCELETVSRAAVAVFLAEFLRLPPPAADHFDDDDGLPEEAAINRVADAGVAGGCGVRLYCPNFTASRDHMAVYLVNALVELPAVPQGTDYFDDDDGSDFEDEINKLAHAGIVTGCGQRLYCPSFAVTKDHLAAFLYNAMEERP